MGTLSRLVTKAGEEGFLSGFHITNPHSEGLMISHLLFADDNLVFCKLDESNLGYLRCILLLFETMSGLRVNFSKSALIPASDVPNVHMLTPFLGCGVDHLPSLYLGLPLGAPYKSIAIWDPVIKRFHKRLAG